MNFPKVSVIIPTKNSEEFLELVLTNISHCRLYYQGDVEIIVVDNFSTDKTEEIAKGRCTFYRCGNERAAQANYGISKATGDIIYLTGSDLLRDNDFISECMERIIAGYDAVYMSVLTDPRVRHFWGRVKALERESYVDTKIESARFFKRSVWEDLGGLDDSLIQMEEDFQHRLDRGGFKTGRVDAREYHLHEEDSLVKIFKKFYYYGKFCGKYLKKHKVRGLRQLNPVRPNLHLFLSHPILLCGLIIYKVVQYTAGILGVLNAKE